MTSVTQFISPELEVFSSNPHQIAIDKMEDYVYQPINSTDNTNIVEFQVLGSSDRMKILDQIYLEGTLQMLKDDKTDYEAGDKMGHLLRGGLTSIIKSCTVYFNDVMVMNFNDHYGFIEFLQNTLSYSTDTIKARLGTYGYFVAGDKSLASRMDASKKVTFCAKLNCLNFDRYLLPNVTIRIKLVLQGNSFCVVENKDDKNVYSKSHLKVSEMKLIVPNVTVKSDYLFDIERRLMKQPAIYETKFGEVFTTTIPRGQTSFSIQSLYTSQRPSFVALCLQPNEIFGGNSKSDPFIFKTQGVKQFNFLVDHVNVPVTPLNIINDDEEVDYYRAFQNIYKTLGLRNENRSCAVNETNFLTDYFFLTEDISKGNVGVSSITEGLETVNLGFNLVFKKALSEPMTVVMFCLLNRKIAITHDRQIHLVY
jgi:hypothetical protein